MNALPREVLKWLQSLDLSISVKNPKWDFSNGYLVAEILSWYHPKEIKIHCFNNGTSIQSKLLNWNLLETFFKNKNYAIDRDVMEGTIHCKSAAAEVLVEQLYTTLTNRPTYRLTPRNQTFNDLSYQSKLPLHARATASTAIKNNLANTELETGPDTSHLMSKTQHIISLHQQHRQSQRLQDPDRFGIKPTLGEIRPKMKPESSQNDRNGICQSKQGRKSRPVSANRVPENVQFAEIKVKQSGRDLPASSMDQIKGQIHNDMFGTYQPTIKLGESTGYSAVAQHSR
ncbi:spermatogenesis-associated protein 4-like isoform X2 [Bolinopsis microptera]|uniref:spermatogenesis-associated protein 4-like isoform X2 n=1 Tax=Bolinopsis microptera TaxID=2820187 RepID=UPI0030795A52